MRWDIISIKIYNISFLFLVNHRGVFLRLKNWKICSIKCAQIKYLRLGLRGSVFSDKIKINIVSEIATCKLSVHKIFLYLTNPIREIQIDNNNKILKVFLKVCFISCSTTSTIYFSQNVNNLKNIKFIGKKSSIWLCFLFNDHIVTYWSLCKLTMINGDRVILYCRKFTF